MSAYDYLVSYGKKRVPVYRVSASPLVGVTPIPESPFTGRGNEVFALDVDVEVLAGDFLESYTHGDNSRVVATDSMKNIVIRQALTYEGATLEGFLHVLGQRFVATYEQIHVVRVSAREMPFIAAPVPAGGAGFSASTVLFDRVDADYATGMIETTAHAGGGIITDHRCGRIGMRLLKTTGSAFTSFVRDADTTLPDRRDRPLFITLDVEWRYHNLDDLLGAAHARYVPAEQVRDLIRATFQTFVSESIQQLIHEFGVRLLARFPQLQEVSFRAENRTRDPYGASETDPRIKVYSDPFPAFGEITLTMRRTSAGARD